MINRFNDYEEIKVYEGGAALEVGGYELKIIGAKVEQYPTCEILKIAYDIINHETYADYFKKKFESAKAQNPEAKWSGVFDVFLPKNDGSEKDQYTKQNFKRFITSVEQSNQGYVWNWDENSLKGKMFGGIFGREEFETKDGQRKFAVKCRFPRSIETIRSGNYKVPDDKMMSTPASSASSMVNRAAASQLDTYTEILDDGNMPF